MTAAALRTLGGSRHQRRGRQHGRRAGGRAGRRRATPRLAVLEVDEMHVPHVADAVEAGRDHPAQPVPRPAGPGRRDQRDRAHGCGRGWPGTRTAVVVANCDDVLMTSAAYDSANVVWVAAGGSWAADSVSCPRSGEVIVREQAATGIPPEPTSNGPPRSGGSTTKTSMAQTDWRCRCSWRCRAR